VRINPNEVHIRDGEFYDELYTSSKRPRDKPSWYYWRIGKGSMFGALDHKRHRMRRSVLDPFFSKQSIYKIEPFIQEKVDLWVRRIRENGKDGQVVSMGCTYMALLLDIISFYAFGFDWGLLQSQDFGLAHKKLVKGTLECMAYVRHFPYLVDVAESLPDWFARRLNNQIALMLGLQYVRSVPETFVSGCQKDI